ncbi:hypothetical protein [Aneurinibacillus aneurinilyticus]|nr:hypothetical protein [Aneurinibacillus aneurinilyticus]MCI1694753.1 hypothetical protein [Aneurinibacillus aneurinilyticus]
MFWDCASEAALPYHRTRERDEWLKTTIVIGTVLVTATRPTQLVATLVRL